MKIENLDNLYRNEEKYILVVSYTALLVNFVFENVLISNETKDDVIEIVVWGFVLAVIVGVLTYVLRALKGR